MEGYIGEIRMFAGNFTPKNWFLCYGQELEISNFITLYSIIGLTYGGKDAKSFCLPDLRGKVPVGVGQFPGYSDWILGQQSGVETNVLSIENLPPHTHVATGTAEATVTVRPVNSGTATINAKATLHADSTGATNDPTGKFLANTGKIGPSNINAYGSTADITMNEGAVTVEGTVDLGIIPAPIVDVTVNEVNVIVQNTGSGYAIDNTQPSLGMNYIICHTGLYPERS